MQVFIIGTPLETAQALDARRLNKQIIECRQISRALSDPAPTAWDNHPAVLQYRWDDTWLHCYTRCLEYYRKGEEETARRFSDNADKIRPDFHTPEYFDQMKRRLYTKNPQHYAQFAHLGTSETNWYFVDGSWKYYENGKLIKQ